MSFKAKNLAYERPEEPAFLARMRAQVSGQGDPERPARASQPQRNIAARNQKHDEDDEPTVVDEEGNALNDQEVAALNDADAGESGDGEMVVSKPRNGAPNEEQAGGERRRDAQDVTEAGGMGPAGRKRKAPRVVADVDQDTEGGNVGSVKTSTDKGASATDSTTGKGVARKKKKAKVALSFDTDA